MVECLNGQTAVCVSKALSRLQEKMGDDFEERESNTENSRTERKSTQKKKRRLSAIRSLITASHQILPRNMQAAPLFGVTRGEMPRPVLKRANGVSGTGKGRRDGFGNRMTSKSGSQKVRTRSQLFP